MEVLELVVRSLEPPPAVPLLELQAHREDPVLLRRVGPIIASEAPPMIIFAAERRAAATFGQNPFPRCAGPPTPRPTQRCQLAAARSWRRELLLLVYNKLSP